MKWKEGEDGECWINIQIIPAFQSIQDFTPKSINQSRISNTHNSVDKILITDI